MAMNNRVTIFLNMIRLLLPLLVAVDIFPLQARVAPVFADRPDLLKVPIAETGLLSHPACGQANTFLAGSAT